MQSSVFATIAVIYIRIFENIPLHVWEILKLCQQKYSKQLSQINFMNFCKIFVNDYWWFQYNFESKKQKEKRFHTSLRSI